MMIMQGFKARAPLMLHCSSVNELEPLSLLYNCSIPVLVMPQSSHNCSCPGKIVQ